MAPQPQPDALQTILGHIGTLTVAQLVQLFTRAGTPGFTEMLHAAVPEIVGQHAQAAAAVAAQWYDELAPDATFHAEPVVDLPAERIAKSIDWALREPSVPLELKPEPGGSGLTSLSPPAAQGDEVSLSRLSGSVKRMVYDAARDTITENATAEDVGWARYAFPDACAFCRVLATRSGDSLYMSEHSAQFVVGKRGVARGSRKIGEKYHDHCRCIPFPIRAGDYEPPDYTKIWQEQYEAARNDVGGNLKAILAHMRANTDAA